MAAATTTSGPAASDELLPALHEEIARLPEKYRLAVVLCDLEGMTQAQAAGQLHWSERTLRRRLAEGRDRLKAPTRPAAAWHQTARCSGPCSCARRGPPCRRPGERRPSARRWTWSITAITAGAVSAAAQSLTREVLKIMLLQKLKLASAALLGAGLMAWGASAALISRGDEPRRSRRRLPSPASDADAGRQPRPNRTRSTRPAHSRLAAGCSTPTASRWPAPGSTCVPMPNVAGARTTRWPRGRRGVWRRRMRTAGSISSWTRVRAMARTGGA